VLAFGVRDDHLGGGGGDGCGGKVRTVLDVEKVLKERCHLTSNRGFSKTQKNVRCRPVKVTIAPRCPTYLLVHHVVQKHVLVIRVLVLLGKRGFRVHELLVGAAVRALCATRAGALARSLAHDSKTARRLCRPRFTAG